MYAPNTETRHANLCIVPNLEDNMKRFIRVHRHPLILFSLSVTLCCLALGTTVRAENQSTSQTQVQRTKKQKPRVRRPTVTKQEKKVQRTDMVKKKKTSNRLHRLHSSWVRNKAKTETKRSQQQAETIQTQNASRPPADPTDTLKLRNAVNLGFPTLQLPTPFYADIHNEGDRLALDFGVQSKDGNIYTFIEEEVTGEGVTRSIGIGSSFRFNHDGTFFIRARDMLLFVPKKIGTGVRYFGRGIKRLFW